MDCEAVGSGAVGVVDEAEAEAELTAEKGDAREICRKNEKRIDASLKPEKWG
jgi:hypothetical protein